MRLSYLDAGGHARSSPVRIPDLDRPHELLTEADSDLATREPGSTITRVVTLRGGWRERPPLVLAAARIVRSEPIEHEQLVVLEAVAAAAEAVGGTW